MTYVMSDLHGYPLHEVKKLLEKAEFGKNDYLYILGDVIDRGNEGIKTLLWMMGKPNIELILGNHEAMMLSCEFILDEVNENFALNFNMQKMSLLSMWQLNGAAPTRKELTVLPASQRKCIFEYLHDAPLLKTVYVGDRGFILTHSGLGSFDSSKKIIDYTSDELLWNRPVINQKYFSDKKVVFGHTPTVYYGNEFAGKILKTDTWIDIDAGAGCGFKPALLCLDTLNEYYL